MSNIWMTVPEVLDATGGHWHKDGDPPPDYFDGVSTDSRKIRRGDLFVALCGERFDGHSHLQEARDRGAAAALVERTGNVPIPQILVEDTRKSMLALALKIIKKRRERGGKMVVLTGSAGKTTTRELIRRGLSSSGASVLASAGNENNEIGVPLTLWGWRDSEAYAVIEVGVRKKGDIGYFGDVVLSECLVITSIGPSHLETLGTLSGVWEEKSRLIEKIREGGFLVLPEEVWQCFSSPFQRKWMEDRKIHLILTRLNRHESPLSPIVSERTFSDSRITSLEGAFSRRESGYFLEGELLGESFSIRMDIPSPELAMDMLLAIGACRAFGVGLEKASEAIGEYRGGEGRMQPLTGKNGVLYLLDHYNANPLSMDAAFSLVENYHGGEWSSGKLWGILGEMLELGEDAEMWHRHVGEKAARIPWSALWFKGNFFESFREGFSSSGGDPSILHHINGAGSSENRYQSIGPGDIVLVKASRGTALESEFPYLGLEL
jgi:UDP-N-acetylmuramoyl-tripeptide--D-alanyl-D-alanine ligase